MPTSVVGTVALVLVAGLFSFGCGKKMPPELVGTWQASGAIGDPNQPGPAWTKSYELRDDGTFRMSGYPPIEVKGTWKVPERDGARFRIVLENQKMTAPGQGEASAWPDEDGWADLEGDQLTWQSSVYVRQRP